VDGAAVFQLLDFLGFVVQDALDGLKLLVGEGLGDEVVLLEVGETDVVHVGDQVAVELLVELSVVVHV